MKRDLRLERTYPHPPELVWRALTDPDLLAEWLMPNDFVPEVGHRFTMRADPEPGWDGIVKLEVMEIDPPRRMRWAWRSGPLDTELTFELEPAIVYARPATTLVLKHTGFRGLEAVLVSFIMKAGWGGMMSKIFPFLLEKLERGEPVVDLRAAHRAQHGRWKIWARIVGPWLERRRARA